MALSTALPLAQGIAAGPAAPSESSQGLTPEQKMQRRFPQPVRVGDLIGLPVLDHGDATIGYVRQVVRTADGKISLILPYSAWFGWARTEWRKRQIAIPIEAVVLLGRHINSIDLSREDIGQLPDWRGGDDGIDRDEKILIGLGRR